MRLQKKSEAAKKEWSSRKRLSSREGEYSMSESESRKRTEEVSALQDKRKMLVKLFLSTLYLSAFTFGGGYVIITLMKKKFVDDYHWIDEQEMLDLVAIAQSAPGPIAVNGAIVVGYKLAGVPGLLMAITGTIIPPFVILSVISFFYEAFRSNIWVGMMLSGMQAGVGAVIAAVVYDMGEGIVRGKNGASIVIMIAAFVAAYILKVNVIYVVLACGALGAFRTLIAEKRKGGES